MAELRSLIVVLGAQLDLDAAACDAFDACVDSKPCIATGKHIQRMSPRCRGCRHDPAQHSGASSCPFTTLHWDFLMRHEPMLAKKPRMTLQVKNLARLTDVQRQAVYDRAAAIRRGEVGVEAGVAAGADSHA